MIQTQQNTFVLFTLFKLTLDECKTLTKISMRNCSQQFPQTSACFGHDETIITDNKSFVQNWKIAVCIIGGESRGIRISSRNNGRIKTTRLVLYKTLHYSCTKLASFCLYGSRNIISTKTLFSMRGNYYKFQLRNSKSEHYY